MNIEPGCRWRVRITGDIQCMQPDAWDWAGIAQVSIEVALFLLLMGFFGYQLWRAYQDRKMREAVREARYNRFLDLLRYVKWSLLNRAIAGRQPDR